MDGAARARLRGGCRYDVVDCAVVWEDVDGRRIMSKTICCVCDSSVVLSHTYGDGVCPICARQFIWDEGIQMLLTDEDLRILAAHDKAKRDKKGG